MEHLVKSWFEKWKSGDYLNLPISDDFIHESPYGIILGKSNYLNLVEDNLDKFLGHRFEIHDAIYKRYNACVRYTAVKDNFKLNVSEWYYSEDVLIDKIIAYYNIEGQISDDRKIEYPENK